MSKIQSESNRPAPYYPSQTREWIVCDGEFPDDLDGIEGIKGFGILIRTSITNLEQAELMRAHDEVAERSDKWGELPAAERDLLKSPRFQEWELIAPYILEWNARGLTVEGEEDDIPPPALAGVKAFELLGPTEANWITRIVLSGYMNTGKVRKSRKPFGRTGSTSALPVEGSEIITLPPR